MTAKRKPKPTPPPEEWKSTVTKCALLVESDGKVYQAHLTAEQSRQLINVAVAICGGKLAVGEPMDSLTLGDPQ